MTGRTRVILCIVLIALLVLQTIEYIGVTNIIDLHPYSENIGVQHRSTKAQQRRRAQSTKRLPSEHHNSEWKLPIATIEDMIVESDDYHTTQERRLVVCAANQEYVDFADNFVHQLLHQNITNFVIVPLDQDSYEKLHPIYPHHTLPTFPLTHDNPLDKDIRFGSIAFKQLTASRPNFLRQILQQVPNVTIFYNDIDMVWKSNAWQVLDERLQIAQSTPTDTLVQAEVETAMDRRNIRKPVPHETASPIVTTLLWHDGPGLICTCMLYLKPTVNNMQLLIDWEEEILHDTEGRYLSDQDAFIAYSERTQLVPISNQKDTYAVHPVQTTNVKSSSTSSVVRKQEPSTPSYMTVLFRNDHEFPHGHRYNWEYNATAERQENANGTSKKYHPSYAVIVHNNWIKGKGAKLRRFQLSGLWNPSGLL